MKNKRFRQYNSIRNNRGTTLVEMIVCFALLAILMVAATEIIHSAMRTYTRVKQSGAGQEISDLICDKIDADLSGAVTKRQIPDVSDDNTEIFYYDKYNRPVHIMNKEGYLYFAYGKDEEESRWSFDSAIYRGYTIQEIKFYKVMPADVDSRSDEDKGDAEFLDNSVYSDDIYKVQLTMYNKKDGEFVTERYIRCRNMNQ
ncbi:MAG: prepilin-type N-terminal cleavage/methylation domain-containing protein [Lachnospiraceae bacterium]|nr:prepilin-type N-terminal cleavage/methylation domain-containing protein [Lachnospiraceae bacterium]